MKRPNLGFNLRRLVLPYNPTLLPRRLTCGSLKMSKEVREAASQRGWAAAASREATNTVNPIRHCTEIHYVDAVSKCKKKELFKVSIGDPSVFGNLPPHPAVNDALREAASNMAYNGLPHSAGVLETRQCVAEQQSKYPTPYPVTKDDVFMTCGSQGALEISLRVLCEPGQTILLPKPCYTFYKCQADGLGLLMKYYRLQPQRSWEVDLEDLDQQLKGDVTALVVNNPSNPCGSVYSKQHLLDILTLAEKHQVPIIADEIYADMVFEGEKFHPLGALSENVPILSCGGISKRFLVPGWRCGWLILHDRHDILGKEVRSGIANLLMKLIIPATVIQAAIPAMYKNVPASFFTDTMRVFEENAKLCFSGLKDVPGLTPVMPAGALYIMVKIDLPAFPEFESDTAFLKQLIVEQGVVCLPGSVFQCPDAMRLVLIMPEEKLLVVCSRIRQFCTDHYRK